MTTMLNDAEKLKLKRINKKPLAYCRWMAQRPGLWFGLTLGGHILITLLNGVLFGAGYDIMPVVFDAFPVDIMNDLQHRREDAWSKRNDDNGSIPRFTVDDIGPTWPRGYHVDTIELFWKSKENVFSKEYLEQMQQIEDSLFFIEEYQTSFCQLNSDLNCTKPGSLLRYFDGTFQHISDVFYDPKFENINGVLYEAYSNIQTKEDFQYFLTEGYDISPNSAVSYITRSAFRLGWPLEGPEDEDQQYDLVEQFVKNNFKPALNKASEKPRNGLSLYYFSALLFGIDIMPSTIGDMMLAIGSLGFIIIFMWVQTGSFWITGWAMFSIITSFWITNLIYRTIINYAYFGFFHVIAIFIILGIGADDIFVFYNTWKATGIDDYPSLAHRLSDSYRIAAGTMFFTSFTTMMAFLVGGISPVLPLGSFGIFTGVLVAVNYISVIVFFPNVILMHHLYFEKRCCTCCLCPHEKKRIDREDQDSTDNDKPLTLQKKKKHPIVRFFGGPFFRFVTHKVIRWIIIIVFTAFMGFCIWSATRIEPSAEQIKIYRETNNYGKAMKLSEKFVPSGDHYVNLYLVWGLTPTDFSWCHFTDYKCLGTREYDEVFDLNTPQAQRALVDFCQRLKYGMSTNEIEKLHIKNNSITGLLEVDCFMDDLELYLREDQHNMDNSSLDLSYPLSQDNMAPFMASKPAIYDMNALGRDFYRFFEIGVSFWMSDSYTMLTSPGYLIYDRLIGEAVDEPFTQPARFHYNLTNGTGPFGYYGTKLRYAAVRVNLTLPNTGLGYTQGIPVFDDWDAFLQDQMATMPANMRQGYPVTDYNWHWLIIQKTLERGAWMGMGISIAIACFILILATMNIIVGLLATLLIGCVTAGVLGVIPLAGWKIDVMISMNLTLLVGLSVDYIVHIAEGYHLSESSDRLGRIRDMLENLGISILNGALTTLGAAFFMLFSKIQFFFQFGTFLFCIIAFSMTFSLVFFPAVMSLIGPEGDTGSIITPFKKLHYKVIGREKADMKCSQCNGKGFHKADKNNRNGSLLDVKSKEGTKNGCIGPYTQMDAAKDESQLANSHVTLTPDTFNEEVAYL